jgi:L-iditol 2-dehydrogenase
MKALQFDVTVPRYVAGRILGAVYKPLFWSGLSCLRYLDLPEPALPGPDWVKIRTKYGGICGSDWGLIQLHNSPYLSPFSSKRFVIGHENLGTIVEVGPEVQGWHVGERVVADLMLPCAARGFSDPCEPCRRGDYNLCERFAVGGLAPGTVLGACADTGGSWGPVYVAHESQLLRVPDNVSDANAVLLDAVSATLHPILREVPDDGNTVLVLGAGVMGLCTVAALRALDSKARILVLAKYKHQADLARHYGADEVILVGRGQDRFQAMAQATGAKIYKPILGKPAIVGGADVVYECVGSDGSVDDALRLARAGGRVVLVGLASIPKGVDWTPIWFREIRVAGTYAVAMDPWRGETARTYAIGLELMAEGKLDLEPLLTHKFALSDYRAAFRAMSTKNANGLLKSVFAFD